jgi:hypothetical protein
MLRGALVFAVFFMAQSPCAQAQQAEIHFLSSAQARTALTEGDERNYYARLDLAEMRAKTGLPLENMTLAAARAQVREAYGAAAEDFTAEEQVELREAIDAQQPILQSRAPLYARTPWSFIKVSSNIEGALPHTRGSSIVLADTTLAALTRRHAQTPFDKPSPVWNLLVHEQTHVLERHDPALFATLYTGVFGFEHAALPPPPQWLRDRVVVNPDSPDADWIFPIGDGVDRYWVLPEIVLRTLEQPRMPQDFDVVALSVTQQAEHWHFADQTQPASYQELANLEVYARAFPDHQEMFHPNEIAAVMLAAIISGYGIQQPEHELWAKTRAWAAQALR